jgi:hypothetical protein
MAWGVFTQNNTGLVGDTVDCSDKTECRVEQSFTAPDISGTFIVGADASDTKGMINRGVGELYVED